MFKDIRNCLLQLGMNFSRYTEKLKSCHMLGIGSRRPAG